MHPDHDHMGIACTLLVAEVAAFSCLERFDRHVSYA